GLPARSAAVLGGVRSALSRSWRVSCAQERARRAELTSGGIMKERPAALGAPYAAPAAEVVAALGSDAERGLSGALVAERRAEHGKNELAQAPPTPWWKRLARQFADIIIWILIAAALI